MQQQVSLSHESALSAKEIAQFERDGFIGPFDGTVSPAILDAIGNRLCEIIDSKCPHPIYQRFSVHDWHLLDQNVLALFVDPSVTRRLQSLLGPDLILWRSKIFDKRLVKDLSGGIRSGGPLMAKRLETTFPVSSRPILCAMVSGI